MRTVEWDYERNEVRLIDQRLLPGELRYNSYADYKQLAVAIREMVVRGAPAIGVTGAFGLALAAQRSRASTKEVLIGEMKEAARVLENARPTAVNLGWGLRCVMTEVEAYGGEGEGLRIAVIWAAQRMADEDVAINIRMAKHGAALIEDGDTIIHHCNTGALAAVDWGTALGVIRMAHEQGKKVHVLVDETRPRLQGARLTAWELQRYGIPFDIITDGAAGFFIRSGQVQKTFFGADRVAANGDVVNKVGTYMLALAAHDNSIPVFTVVPTSTIDLSIANGDQIPIEERNPEEVLDIQVSGHPVAPIGATALNPAFDITPHRLLSAIVTEKGIIYPPFDKNLMRVVPSNLK